MASSPSTFSAPLRSLPCVLMRAGTSRGPFFLRDWLPADERLRDQALIGAIGASDLLQVDGVGGGNSLTSKVAIVSRSNEPSCQLDYLFAQVGVGQSSVDTRPNCGNMLSGVVPFALEQGLVDADDGETTVRVFNVNTKSRIDVTVLTPNRRIRYDGLTSIDGVAGTAAPIRLNFLDAWGAITGKLFPTGRRVDELHGVRLTCIDAAMPLMIVQAAELGLAGTESPAELDANLPLLEKLESLRRAAGELMGLGDVSTSVVPKPVIVSAGEDASSIRSRYFTPKRCHASHAVTGAIGVATAFALPGTVASSELPIRGVRKLTVLHPQGRIEVEVKVDGEGEAATIERAALVRTARKIFQGELHLPDYVFSQPADTAEFPSKPITLVVPTSQGGGNDAMARAIAEQLGTLLGQQVVVDNRAGANGTIASDYVATAAPDGHTLILGYIGTHGMNPALQALGYDPVSDFAPVGRIGYSPTLLVANAATGPASVKALAMGARTWRYASAGTGTAPHFAAELFRLNAGVKLQGVAYRGSAPAVADVLEDRCQLMFPSLFTALPHVQAGRLKALAVAGPERLDALPEVPTLKELGIAGVEVLQWYGVFAPARTPPDIVARLNAALNAVLADPAIARRLQAHGTQIAASSPEEFGALVKAELGKWKQVVQQARLTAD
ncbi:4-oxalomesaconate tautomerase [Pelomonas sp. KK5]|uniref:4-oxalomesaconate tautomerase n=1 Tax=Pelomonas sp. KK5 TaxID=1855730 RepID=UPI00097C40FA|nr:4-oxalomesaconate tautomerase [Pelomonas sp. KK5]